jgi:hypothetical protein
MVMNISNLVMLKESSIKAIKSLLSRNFRKGLENLSPDLQQICRQKYLRWRTDYQSLRFEPKFMNIFVVEITRDIHAICMNTNNVVYWLWIGKYRDYTVQLDLLRKTAKTLGIK